MLNVSKIAPNQFVNDRLAKIPGGTAFIYLFRRYGYPNYYGQKIVAGYEVETTVKGLFVTFSIKDKTCWIGVTATDEIDERYRRESLENYQNSGNSEKGSSQVAFSDFCASLHHAIRDCLLDQLNPVQVDSEFINVLGNENFQWDNEADEIVGLIPYYELDAT